MASEMTHRVNGARIPYSGIASISNDDEDLEINRASPDRSSFIAECFNWATKCFASSSNREYTLLQKEDDLELNDINKTVDYVAENKDVKYIVGTVHACSHFIAFFPNYISKEWKLTFKIQDRMIGFYQDGSNCGNVFVPHGKFDLELTTGLRQHDSSSRQNSPDILNIGLNRRAGTPSCCRAPHSNGVSFIQAIVP